MVADRDEGAVLDDEPNPGVLPRTDPRAEVAAIGSLESTAHLLAQVRAGDGAARDRLVRRYLAPLRRWAHGRLPARARDLLDTDDLVQVTLLKALDHVKGFEPRREGAFLAYLRRMVLNQVLDEIRRARRQPGRQEMPEEIAEVGPSPLEKVLGREALDKYETALAALPEDQREAIVMRIELGFTHQQVAEALGSPSGNAARMLVARGLVRLAEVMHERR